MKYVKKFAAKLFDLWFPPRKDEEELVNEIQATVKYLKDLCEEADTKNIIVVLESGDEFFQRIIVGKRVKVLSISKKIV